MKKSGQITIFLSMTLLLICAVLFAAIEAVRVTANTVYLQMMTDTALESSFGEYCRPLWEEYRLLALEKDPALESRVCRYLEGCRTPAGEGGTFLRIDEPEVIVLGRTTLADDGARFLQEEAADYMKDRAAAAALENLLEEFSLLEQIRSAASFVKKAAAFTEDILTAEASLRKIREAADGILVRLGEAAQIGAEVREACEAYDGDRENDPEGARQQRQEALFHAAARLETASQGLETDWGDLCRAWESYEKAAGRLAEKGSALLEELENGKYQDAIRSLLEEQAEPLQDYSSQGGWRYEAAAALRNLLEEKVGLAGRLAGVIRQIAETEEIDWRTELEALGRELESAADLSLPDWLEELEEPDISEAERGSFDFKIWTEEAVLKLAVGDRDLSSAALPESGRIPQTAGETGAQEEGGLSSELLFRAYLSDMLSSFGEEKASHHMQYELEYLLGGKSSDRENLLAVVGELLLVREGVNFLEYVSDTVKCREALAAASALLGITGSPVLIKALQIGILAAWALDSAAEDVRDLMQGGSAALLSLFGKEWVMLDYTGYLRVLLAFRNTGTLRFRCLELIQATLRDRTPGFCMADCLYGAEIEVRSGNSRMIQRFDYDS